jgi:hypothetical protein
MMKRVALFMSVALLLAAGFGLAGNALVGADPAVAVTLQQVEPENVESLDAITRRVFSYQGYLEEGGSPVSGNRDLIVRLYSNAACTNQVGPNIPRDVTAENGRFSMTVPVDEDIFTGERRFLQIEIGGTAIGCREILAAPYALSLRPGAVISGSIDYTGDYGGAALAVLNDAGRAIYGEKLGAGSGAAGYFINRGAASGVHAESEQGDGIRAYGGDGSGDYGGEFRGWGGIYTRAASGPGVLVTDAAGVASTYSRDPGDVVASDDLLADNALGLGAPGVHGGMYVRDDANEVMLEFTASNALLTLGGPGDDGDLYIQDSNDARRYAVDGQTGDIFVYDGTGTGVADQVYHFDANATEPTHWGDRTSNLGDFVIKSNDDVIVYLEQTNPLSSVGEFLIKRNDGATVCSMNEVGNLTCSGVKNAVVDTESHGKRKLYAVESPEVWFEDFGSGQLQNGAAVINFEPIFAETVNTGVPYQVYLTPVGGWAGLYVTDKTPASFTVRAEGNDSNTAFDYRIVAKRLGYEDVRLEPFTEDAAEAEVDEPSVEPAGAVVDEEATSQNAESDLGQRDPALDVAPAQEAQE